MYAKLICYDSFYKKTQEIPCRVDESAELRDLIWYMHYKIDIAKISEDLYHNLLAEYKNEYRQIPWSIQWN